MGIGERVGDGPILTRDDVAPAQPGFEVQSVLNPAAARLDTREDSGRLTAALGEILRALQLELAFETQTDPERTQILVRLLGQPRPAALAANWLAGAWDQCAGLFAA